MAVSEVQGLEKSLTHLEQLDQDDPGVARAMAVLQEEMVYADTENVAEDEMPKEPLRKEVAGISAFSVALLIIWLAEQFGVPMEMEVALAIAGIIGGIAAYLKSESYFVGER